MNRQTERAANDVQTFLFQAWTVQFTAKMHMAWKMLHAHRLSVHVHLDHIHPIHHARIKTFGHLINGKCSGLWRHLTDRIAYFSTHRTAIKWTLRARSGVMQSNNEIMSGSEHHPMDSWRTWRIATGKPQQLGGLILGNSMSTCSYQQKLDCFS